MIYNVDQINTGYINERERESNEETLDFFLNEMCASDGEAYTESVIDDIKDKILTEKDIWDQWMAKTNHFVNHRWLDRLITDKQKEQLEKHYDVLKDDNCYYSTYKRSFQAIAKFMGLTGNIIIENVVFDKDEQDPDMWKISVKYSKGLVKIIIPDNIELIHATPEENAKSILSQGLIPTFRSKTKGKYLYPSKRCFFTIGKVVSGSKMGTGSQKLAKLTPVENFKVAYIDPTYNDYFTRAVYIETEQPIKVTRIQDKFKLNLFKK
jgi:hypothetical protein